MKQILFPLAAVAALLSFSGCGHHRDVRPGPNGLNSVTVKADNEDDGARDALAQANHYCDEFKKHAVIMEENNKYVGDMDEKTYKTVKKVSKVAKTIGVPTGGTTAGTSHKGGVLDDVASEGYSVTMKFRCE